MRTQALTAARTLIDGEWHADVVVHLDGEGRIADLDGRVGERRHVDLPGCDLIPGLVDLHSDCLDEKMHPRPMAHIGLADALVELDTELVAHGITTHYLCVSIETDTGTKRSVERAEEILRALKTVRPYRRA